MHFSIIIKEDKILKYNKDDKEEYKEKNNKIDFYKCFYKY